MQISMSREQWTLVVECLRTLIECGEYPNEFCNKVDVVLEHIVTEYDRQSVKEK